MDQKLIDTLVAMPVEEIRLLACGEWRYDGVVSTLSRHQLTKLVPLDPIPHGLPTENLVGMARYTLQYALLQKRGAPEAKLKLCAANAETATKRMLEQFYSRTAQGSAKPMTDIATPENTTTEAAKKTPKPVTGAAKPATGKDAAKPVADKAKGKAPAKAAATKAPAKGATAAKPAKAAKPEGTGKAGRPSAAPDNRKLKLLVKENPKRGASAQRYELYRTSKTVADYIAAGGVRADIAYDVAKGFIEVSEK